MAETVTEFTPNGRPKYPWQSWTDGQIWRLERDKDFRVGRESMRQAVYDWARRKGLKVTVHHVGNDNLEIQFFQKGSEK